MKHFRNVILIIITLFALSNSYANVPCEVSPNATKIYIVIKGSKRIESLIPNYVAKMKAQFAKTGIRTEAIVINDQFKNTIYDKAKESGADHILFIHEVAQVTRDSSTNEAVLLDVISFDLKDSFSWKEIVYQLALNMRVEDSVFDANDQIIKTLVKKLEL